MCTTQHAAMSWPSEVICALFCLSRRLHSPLSPPKGSLYGQWYLPEPVVRVKLFSRYSCSFREARGVESRRNQRGWQAAHPLPQLFGRILATVCCSGINLKAIKAPQHGHHGLCLAVHYLCLKTSYCGLPRRVKWQNCVPFDCVTLKGCWVPSVAPETWKKHSLITKP